MSPGCKVPSLKKSEKDQEKLDENTSWYPGICGIGAGTCDYFPIENPRNRVRGLFLVLKYSSISTIAVNREP